MFYGGNKRNSFDAEYRLFLSPETPIFLTAFLTMRTRPFCKRRWRGENRILLLTVEMHDRASLLNIRVSMRIFI